MEYSDIKEFAKYYRSELVPIMNKMGFKVSITTSHRGYWRSGTLNINIKKVPLNFEVWDDKYNRYNVTGKARKLTEKIESRLDNLLNEKYDDTSSVEINVNFDRNIPYLETNRVGA